MKDLDGLIDAAGFIAVVEMDGCSYREPQEYDSPRQGCKLVQARVLESLRGLLPDTIAIDAAASFECHGPPFEGTRFAFLLGEDDVFRKVSCNAFVPFREGKIQWPYHPFAGARKRDWVPLEMAKDRIRFASPDRSWERVRSFNIVDGVAHKLDVAVFNAGNPWDDMLRVTHRVGQGVAGWLGREGYKISVSRVVHKGHQFLHLTM